MVAGLNYAEGTAAPPAGDLFEIMASPGGGWAEPQRAKAVSYNGHTYIGSIQGGSVGDVTVVEVNESTQAVTTHVLNSSLNGEGVTADMHSNPALLVRDSDKRLLAAYCDHNDSTIRLRVSVNTLTADPTLSGGFDTERSLDTELNTSNYDYPSLVQLLGETDDPIYLFFRSSVSGTSRWLVSKNTDAAVSGDDASNGWSNNQWVYRNTGFEPYMQVNSNGVDRIDFIAQNKNEVEVTNNEIRHWYYQAGEFFKTDGTSLGTYPLVSPITPATATLAADGAGYHLFGLERDDVTGDIAFTASARVSGVHHVYRVMWDGAAWATSDITTSEAPYSWGNGIDPNNFDRALVSRFSGGVADLWEYVNTGGGWVGTQHSPGGGDDWLWPIFVRNGTADLEAVVLYGTYITYTDNGFLLAIWGLPG